MKKVWKMKTIYVFFLNLAVQKPFHITLKKKKKSTSFSCLFVPTTDTLQSQCSNGRAKEVQKKCKKQIIMNFTNAFRH